jgi:hypothetical protein
MLLIIWLVTNVSSILMPFELSPAFFRVLYIAPTHSMYAVLTTIWSHGCDSSDLRWALPVLFAWELFSGCLSGLGVYRRAHYSAVAAECKQREFNEKLEEAIAAEMKKLEASRTEDGAEQSTAVPSPAATNADLEKGQGDQAAVERSEGVRSERQEEQRVEAAVRNDLGRTTTSKTQRTPREQRAIDMAPLGPSFPIAFGSRSEADSD